MSLAGRTSAAATAAAAAAAAAATTTATAGASRGGTAKSLTMWSCPHRRQPPLFRRTFASSSFLLSPSPSQKWAWTWGADGACCGPSAHPRDAFPVLCASHRQRRRQPPPSWNAHRRNNCYYHSSAARPYKELDREAVADLFHQYAQKRDGTYCLDAHDVCQLLRGIGETQQQQQRRDDEDGSVGDLWDVEEGDDDSSCSAFRMGPDEERKIEHLFRVADLDGNGVIDMEEFLENADMFIRDNPARIILVIGGPGSGKGVLSRRLEAECNVVHLSSGSLLRDEVDRQTPLGKEVQEIMAKGELVSSAIMVALMKKKMRDHPGKRVLLDGFPRSLENAHDLVTLCGKPELALHLVCDDTILMERIMKRGENRQDDNFDTALQRIRTYHKFHTHTLEWLREQHVPIVNLDCTGPPDSVWYQMTAIGKLMRPAVKLASATASTDPTDVGGREDWSGDPLRSTALF